MLDPWHPSGPVRDFENHVAGLEKRRKKRHVVFRMVMVLVWLLALAVAFGLGAWWKH